MDSDEALFRLLAALDARGYHFVTPTPSTSRRRVERTGPGARSPRDIFGWSLDFAREDLDDEIFDLARSGGALRAEGERWRSAFRVSTVHGRLFLHSAFPATAADAVFLGPDSYRFADLLARELDGERRPIREIFDIGAGAGVGGLVAHIHAPEAKVTLGDINPTALRLARINARHAGVTAVVREAAGLDGVEGEFDLIISNPPYVAGESGRAYKDGGDLHGARLALDWVRDALPRLAPAGRFILYTGSPILDGGIDQVRTGLAEIVEAAGHSLRYRELDPDIFSGELRRAAYADVERIAAVGAVIARPA